MLKKLHSRLSRGQDWYNTYKKEIKLASNIKIKNKLLFQELEQECKKRDGILTYAEYLAIDQFGNNGYYATSKHHGKTDVEKRWGGALANYCKQENYDRIIEFGCGTGELGIETAKAYKRVTGKKLKWIGVEIDISIHTKILKNFESQDMQDSVEKIVATLDEIPNQQHALSVFPYSLDNIPPHIFLNTTSTDSFPNALLGITVKNGTISEIIIPSEMLQKKGIQLKNGFFTQNSHIYDLTAWKLRKGQRAYISTDAYITMHNFAKKFGDKTTFVIIDEFKKEPWFFNLENLGTPKSLYEHNLTCTDRTRYYRESGKHNLYYPLYKDGLFQFLNTLGFRSVEYEIEQKKANQLRKKPWFPLGKNYRTFAFFAKDFVDKKNKTLVIPFNAQRLF